MDSQQTSVHAFQPVVRLIFQIVDAEKHQRDLEMDQVYHVLHYQLMIEDVVASFAKSLNPKREKLTTLRPNWQIPTKIYKESERTAYSWALDHFEQIDVYKWRNNATNMEIDLETLIMLMLKGGMIEETTGKLKEKYDK